jgi:hypothetical protein
VCHGNHAEARHVEIGMGEHANHTSHPQLDRTPSATRRRRRAVRLAVPIGAIAIVLGACSDADEDTSAVTAPAVDVGEGRDGSGEADRLAPAATEAPAADVAAATGGGELAGDVGVSAGPLSLDQLGRDIAIEATVTVATDDVDGTIDRIIASATAAGGSVFSADVDFTGEAMGGTAGRGTIVVKIPPSGLARLVARLRDDLAVVAYRQDAEDVTEQLIDLASQITNARSSVERVRALLDQATTLDDVLKLETELTRRETELERLLASQRNLDDRVALSTLTVDVVHQLPPEPVTIAPHEVEGRNRLVTALRTGWDAFVAVFFTIALVLATVAPFLVVALLVVLAGWRLNRRLQQPARRSLPDPASPAGDRVSASRPE